MSETQTFTSVSSNTRINVKRLNEEKCKFGLKCAECLSITKRPVRIFDSELKYIRHVKGHDIPISQIKQLVRFGRAYSLVLKMQKMGVIA